MTAVTALRPDLAALWTEMQALACDCNDALIQDVFATNIGDHPDFRSALASLLGAKLGDRSVPETALTRLIAACFGERPCLVEMAGEDLLAIRERDPACEDLTTPFLFYKGWHAVQAQRVAHHLWNAGRKPLAYHLQSRINELFAMDIHPAARLGRRLVIDHGTGIVIGETTIIEDDVSLFQNVTLGGTGKLSGDRHPIVRRGAMVGAGAKILGRLEIGEYARIGAASVVLDNIPARRTAVGNPARLVQLPGPPV